MVLAGIMGAFIVLVGLLSVPIDMHLIYVGAGLLLLTPLSARLAPRR